MHWHSLSLIQLLNDHTFFVPFGCPCEISCMYISIFQQFIAHLIYMHASFPLCTWTLMISVQASTHSLQNPHCKLTVCYFPGVGIWTLSPGLAHDWATFSVFCIYFIFQHLLLLILKNNLSPPTQTYNNLSQLLSRHLWSQQGGRTG